MAVQLTPDRPDRPRSPDASMSLLRHLMTDTVDDGYAQATARRRAAGQRAGVLRRTPVLVLGLLLVGLLLSTAAAQVRARASAQETARTALVTEAQQRTAANDRLEAQLRTLRSEIAATRGEALELTAAGSGAAQRLTTLELRTGAAPATGPGLVVTVDDAEQVEGATGTDPREDEQADPGRVRDGDLQRVVNGLWQAGAEAVQINGQRLTALTAIRSAGEAILVAYRPLSPPYVVEAIGDPAALEVEFLDSGAGLYLQALQENYGIRYETDRSEQLRLRGATGVTLRYATPLETGS